MTDDELNTKLAEIQNDDLKNCHEIYPGWEKDLPYFGWYWRYVDFNAVPLGIDRKVNLIGIMAKNKWYHDEYICTPEESGIIKGFCLHIVNNWSLQVVKELTNFLQQFKDKEWTPCDRDEIDRKTMEQFLRGGYKIVQLK